MNITKKNFDKLLYIGEGTEGIVRKYDENIALKMMYDDEFCDSKKKSINAQCKIEDSNFIFPIDVLHIDRKYRGYTQKLIDGKKPIKEDLNNLKKDIIYIKELENNLSSLTKHHLLIRDLEPRNSIFYQDRLYVIDTSRYVLEENIPYTLIERQNKRLLNYFFINMLIDDTELSIFELNDLIKQMSLKIQSLYGKVYEGVNCYFESPIDFSKFLRVLIEELKVETLDEFYQKVLKFR